MRAPEPVGAAAIGICCTMIFQRAVDDLSAASSHAICVSPRIRRGRPSALPVRYWRVSIRNSSALVFSGTRRKTR